MPRFGELLPADVWAAATRTLSAFAAEELFVYPAYDSIYGGVSPASSASADTFGSWLELVADVGVGRVLANVHVFVGGGLSAGSNLIMEFGEGAAGAEVAIDSLAFEGVGVNHSFGTPLYRALTDNARLSVRVKDGVASSVTYRAAVQLVA